MCGSVSSGTTPEDASKNFKKKILSIIEKIGGKGAEELKIGLGRIKEVYDQDYERHILYMKISGKYSTGAYVGAEYAQSESLKKLYDRAKELEKAKERQEIMEEILYMIERCPRGQKHLLMPGIASLLLAVGWSDRDEILDLYKVWYEKERSGFAPSPSQIKEEIRRIERSGQNTTQVETTRGSTGPVGGYGGSTYRSPMDSFNQSMEDLRQQANIRKGTRPSGSDSDWEG